MATIISGIVTNGVIVTNSPLPEGASVEVHLKPLPTADVICMTPAELRKLPREQRQAILAAAAKLAEADYRNDKELTGFDAFSEEEIDDHEADTR